MSKKITDKEKIRIAKLKKEINSMSLFGISKDIPKIEQNFNPRYLNDSTKNIPSNTVSLFQQKEKEILNEEMQERERVAREELKRKSKRIAPMYNKGAYQYISDETDLTTIGRKI